MNKLLTTIILLCFSVTVAAQGKETWGCQEEDGGGLFWENNRWVAKLLFPNTLLITIPTALPLVQEASDNLQNGTYKVGATPEYEMFCRANFTGSVSCLSLAGLEFFLLDPANGRLGYGSLFGALHLGDTRDTVTTRVYNCTKF